MNMTVGFDILKFVQINGIDYFNFFKILYLIYLAYFD